MRFLGRGGDAHHQRGEGGEPGGVRRDVEAAGDDRVGVKGAVVPRFGKTKLGKAWMCVWQRHLIEKRSNLYTLLLKQLGEDFGRIGFPNGDRGRTLLSVCDFSGSHRSALFNTYAFLSLDMDKSSWWLNGQRAFRRDVFRGGRRLSFKALNDDRRRKVLPIFLDAANAIDGALMVVAIDKDFGSLFSEDDPSPDKEQLLAHWKLSVHEHLLRITHLGAVFVALTSKPGQNVYWITDHDDIASNERQLRALTNVTTRVWSNTLTHDLGHIRNRTCRLTTVLLP